MSDWIKAAAEEISVDWFDIEDARESRYDETGSGYKAADVIRKRVATIIARHYADSLRSERSRVEARIEELRKEIEATTDECRLDSLLDGLTELEAYHFHLPEPKEGTEGG